MPRKPSDSPLLFDLPVRPDGEADLLITHASPREPVWEYILTPTIALENFACFEESICLFGHTHKPAIFRWRVPEDTPDDEHAATVNYLQPNVGVEVELVVSPNQRLLINPGSVGQPRDNDARAAYAIFDTETRMWRQERVAYPIELTQNQMRDAGLPKRLSDRLSFGW